MHGSFILVGYIRRTLVARAYGILPRSTFIPAYFFLAYFFPFSATNRLLRLNHLREQLPQRIQALLGCEYPLGYLKFYFGVFLEVSVELDVEELLFCQYMFASEFDSRTYRCVRVVEEVFEVV
jgi:hypothetical protein